MLFRRIRNFPVRRFLFCNKIIKTEKFRAIKKLLLYCNDRIYRKRDNRQLDDDVSDRAAEL